MDGIGGSRRRMRRSVRVLAGLAACVVVADSAAAQDQRPPATARDTVKTQVMRVYHGRVIGVYDDDSGEPIEGVEVRDVFTGLSALTTKTGNVSLFFVDTAGGVIGFRKVGYGPVTMPIANSLTDTIPVVVMLARVGAVLPTVVTSESSTHYISPALQGFEARRLSGAGGYFISDSVLRRNENTTLADLASARLPGLQALYSDKQKFARAFVSTRKQCRGLALLGGQGSNCQGTGHPDCFVAIYLDGVLRFNAKMADNGVPAPDVEHDFNLINLAGIEYYPGAGTGPVGMHADDDGCGSLWLWTRER